MSDFPELEKRLILLSSTGATYALPLRAGAPCARACRHPCFSMRCMEARCALPTWRPLKASSRKGQALCTEEASFSAWKLAWNTAAPSCVRHANTAYHLCDTISDHGDASALAAAQPRYHRHTCPCRAGHICILTTAWVWPCCSPSLPRTPLQLENTQHDCMTT